MLSTTQFIYSPRSTWHEDSSRPISCSLPLLIWAGQTFWRWQLKCIWTINAGFYCTLQYSKNMYKFIPPKSSLIWMTWFWWNKLLHQYHQFRYPILTSSTLEGFQKRFLKQGGKLLLLEFFISFKMRAWSLTLYWGYFCLPMC